MTSSSTNDAASVQQYLSDNHIEDILTGLLTELGKKQPEDPFRLIAEWAMVRMQPVYSMRTSSSSAASAGAVSEVPSLSVAAPGSSSQLPHASSSGSVGSGSASAQCNPTPKPPSRRTSGIVTHNRVPHRWSVLIAGVDAARDAFFKPIIDVADMPLPLVEEHCKRIREQLRPHFPGKQAMRLAAHALPFPSEDSSVVFFDPAIRSCALEKNIVAMTLADMIVICLDGSESQDHLTMLEGVLRQAAAAGVRGVALWCVVAPRAGSTEQWNEEQEHTALRSKYIPRFSFTDVDDGNTREPILCVTPLALLSKELLLRTVANFPQACRRPLSERSASGSSGEQPLNLAVRAAEIECKITSLGGEHIRLGDRFSALCCGYRFTVTLQTIDIVFSNRIPSNVIRRNVEDAHGDEGVMVTLEVDPGTLEASLNTVGLPPLILIRKDKLTDSVISVIKGHLLSVIADDEGSSSSEEALDF